MTCIMQTSRLLVYLQKISYRFIAEAYNGTDLDEVYKKWSKISQKLSYKFANVRESMPARLVVCEPPNLVDPAQNQSYCKCN